ncbi:MAG: hypothetical protein LBE86_10110 [Gemmobacter sp.]|jgi:hypothetical protein|nr:hypothetical protein [Gemmobacter sp.]
MRGVAVIASETPAQAGVPQAAKADPAPGFPLLSGGTDGTTGGGGEAG